MCLGVHNILGVFCTQVDALCMNGCRPVGKLFRVTQAEGAVVMELDGQPAYPAVRIPASRTLCDLGPYKGATVLEVASLPCAIWPGRSYNGFCSNQGSPSVNL